MAQWGLQRSAMGVAALGRASSGGIMNTDNGVTNIDNGVTNTDNGVTNTDNGEILVLRSIRYALGE